MVFGGGNARTLQTSSCWKRPRLTAVSRGDPESVGRTKPTSPYFQVIHYTNSQEHLQTLKYFTCSKTQKKLRVKCKRASGKPNHTPHALISQETSWNQRPGFLIWECPTFCRGKDPRNSGHYHSTCTHSHLAAILSTEHNPPSASWRTLEFLLLVLAATTVAKRNGKPHLLFSLLTKSSSFPPKLRASCFAQLFEMQTFCIFSNQHSTLIQFPNTVFWMWRLKKTQNALKKKPTHIVSQWK